MSIIPKDHDPSISSSRPFQFSIRSLLLVSLYTAVGLSAVRTFGLAILPSILGIVAAIVGYQLAVFWRRISVYRVLGAYFFGASLGMAALDYFGKQPVPIWKDQTFSDRLLFYMVVTASIAGAIAAWKFRRFESPGPVAESDSERRLTRIFRNQRVALGLWTALIVSIFVPCLLIGLSRDFSSFVASGRLGQLMFAIFLVFIIYIFANMVAICYDVFCIVRAEIGIGYALAYMLICVILGPISLFLVPLRLPIIVSDNLNRRHKWEQRQSNIED